MIDLGCVFCDYQAHCMQDLCVHLVRDHQGVTAGTWIKRRADWYWGKRALRLKRGSIVVCWCGHGFGVGSKPFLPLIDKYPDADWDGEWAAHLAQRGGLAAHLLELTFETKGK